ncbi:hypothetical protein EGW08_020739 [Elysia chlorotica]|uniref:Uncharacterized protein n=1 Tax=Elysia chlorotica TaxID=188477 RepID=A0A3S0ZC04_ELYCH|nr:hypothetical protein EGW08_020739 [Elysia chlorotica]
MPLYITITCMVSLRPIRPGTTAFAVVTLGLLSGGPGRESVCSNMSSDIASLNLLDSMQGSVLSFSKQCSSRKSNKSSPKAFTSSVVVPPSWSSTYSVSSTPRTSLFDVLLIALAASFNSLRLNVDVSASPDIVVSRA